jgi:hypothetical protein
VSRDRRQDLLGIMITLFEMGMCALMYSQNKLTQTFLFVWFGVIAFGVYLVSPMATRSAITDGVSLAERFGWRAGRRDTDTIAVPAEPVVPVPVAVPAVPPTANAAQPELSWPSARLDQPAPTVAAEPPKPKPKRPWKPKPTETAAADGDEFSAEQIDAADVSEKHEAADASSDASRRAHRVARTASRRARGRGRGA